MKKHEDGAGGKLVWWPGGGFRKRQPAAWNYQLGVRIDDFGDIFEGSHPRLRDPFVIKLFAHLTGAKPAAVVAFSREAGQVSSLSHPHIAQVFDSGTLRTGTPFVARERLDGWTLEEHLVFRGPLPLSRLLPLLRSIVSALSAAHAAGIVHGEIRPDNVFLAGVSDGEPGFVKLLDFGVSRLTWARGPVGRGISVDDARYLAPEQAVGHTADVDPRTDQFALAALICRVMHRNALLSRSPVPTRSYRVAKPDLRPDTPLTHRASAFKRVLLQALSERPRDRYPSVAAFLENLEESLVGSGSIPAPANTTGSDQRARQDAVHARGKAARRLFRRGGRHHTDTGRDSQIPRDTVATDPDGEFVSLNPIPREPKSLAVVLMLALVGIGSFAAWGAAWWSPRSFWQETRPWRMVYFATAGSSGTDPSVLARGDQRTPRPASVAIDDRRAVASPSLAFPATEISTAAVTQFAVSGEQAPHRKHTPPLMGYVWSPAEKRLVPSRPNSATAAIPAPDTFKR